MRCRNECSRNRRSRLQARGSSLSTRQAFPFAFLEAFGNKETTLKRLKSGNTNQSDLPGGVLQRNNIHIKVCPEGEVTATLAALRQSPATARHKAKFILATDGKSFEAENLADGETVACAYADFPDHFGFFLPLAGITTVKQIRENAFDIKATGRLNRLYIELLKENPDWDTAARRRGPEPLLRPADLLLLRRGHGHLPRQGPLHRHHRADERAGFLEHARGALRAVPRHEHPARGARGRRTSAVGPMPFPYVNGGLFSGSMDVPRFSKIARSYLLHVGGLDWTKINPDIFGSMIQAVADDEERGALGMHYTSVPNILKVLNPLFLDDLRAKLEEAGDNARKLLNLRNRIARIRVFDPACGSGNFLVIAYKEMRAIEAEINRRRGEADRRSDIPLTNFRGIELRHFSCRDRPPRPHHRRVSVRRALSRPEARPRRVPAARSRQLDHLRQRPAARLAEHLPAHRHRRENPRRRFVRDAAGSGGDRFRE